MSTYKLEKIKRSYDEKTVLETIDLTFEKGKIYALVGENGAGKTTLLETLALLEPPQEGEFLFYDQGVDFAKELSLLRKKIGFCMQRPFLFKTSVFNNLAFGLKVRGEDNIRSKVEKISKLFNLFLLLDKKASLLSGGEAQKVALVRTLVLETPIFLLDEPTANLDAASIKLLETVLVQARDKGKTIVCATHQLDNAYRLADEVITIKDNHAYPQSHPNFFSGEIIAANGLKIFKLNGKVSFIVACEKEGRGKVAIDPKEIILSKEKFCSSARNCLTGKVHSIIDEGNTVKITADCGIKLISQITHKSLNELQINVGQEVFLTFKASSIRIYQ